MILARAINLALGGGTSGGSNALRDMPDILDAMVEDERDIPEASARWQASMRTAEQVAQMAQDLSRG